MRRDCLDSVRDLVARQIPVALVTDLTDGRQATIGPDGPVAGDLDVTAEIRAAVDARHRADKSAKVEVAGRPLFIQVENPPLRLAIVGAVHIAQALVPMARLAGYAVTVIDPRRAFADAERFPEVVVMDEWPDEALEAFQPDRRTAVVTLTHDPKLDDPALEVALASPAFYVAALGSRRTHAKRVDRLKALGLDEAAIGRIHGPAGLAIGAVSPAEIALSVMAEMTAVLRGVPRS